MNTPHAGESSGEIRNDIRRTRAEMDETVDELAERLRPRHLIDDLIEVFRGKAHQMAGSASSGGGSSAMDEAKEYGSAIVGKFKNHPVPAALIGAGLAWLLFDKASGDGSGHREPPGRWRDDELREYSGSYVDARTGQPYDASYGAQFRRGTGEGGGGDSGGPGMAQKAKDAAGRAGEKMADAAGSVKDSIAGAAGSAKDSLQGAASTAGDYRRRAGEWSSSAYGSARHGISRGYDRTRRSAEDALNEYPLAATAAALAAGVLAGLLLPGTHAEDRLMGEQADRLKEQAKDAGREAMERGQQVASETANAVADEARQQGLTPGNLADKAKRVALDAAEAAKESARREGLDDLGQKAKSVAQHGRDVAADEARRQKDEVRSPQP